jgi:hypothetical protein
MMRPFIGVFPSGAGFAVECHGRFGGGYSCPQVSREKAIWMLARDARRYDCGQEPIIISAPADIRAAAGLGEQPCR